MLITGTSGNDTLYGTGVNDVIYGYAGNDNLFGYAGNDAMYGSIGNDVLFASSGNDYLFGGTGNDILHGGIGVDTMKGGSGNDTYYVDNASDITLELTALDGYDTVYSAVSRTLGVHLERLILTGTANINGTGNSMNNNIFGNAGDNFLSGSSGNDGLSGCKGNDILDGGAGMDDMYGGAGDDTYYVDNTSDKTTETSASGGYDTVYSSVSRTLGSNLERLVLTGFAYSGIGNSLNNFIFGNFRNNYLAGYAGNDNLYGRSGNDILNGGPGADNMYGSSGDDTYYVDNASDKTTETSSFDGYDTVISSVSCTLGNYLERLYITKTAYYGGGNNLNNGIHGNNENNYLSGSLGDDYLSGGLGNDILNGGPGADKMVGDAGNDTYYVDNISDKVIESDLSGGIDTVYSSVSRTLGVHLERLVLTGTININGTGNNLDNWLVGNSANNSLYGSSGNDYLNGKDGEDYLNGDAGNDTLVGGTGQDRFCFDSALNVSTNVDTIADFSQSQGDKIYLDNDIFMTLGTYTGTLVSSQFIANSSGMATKSTDRIIYNTTSGFLTYDSDGTGSGVAIQFALLSNKPQGSDLIASDFTVIA